MAMISPRALSRALAQQSSRAKSTVYDKFKFYEGLPIPENKKRFVPGSGTYPQGFSVGSVRAGIKNDSNNQPDLVLVASDSPCSTAAVFTKNAFCAPSITISRDLLRTSNVRGVIANSGCANMMTGEAGVRDTISMSDEGSRALSFEDHSLMVMHTGRGNMRLPMANVRESLDPLVKGMGNSHDHWLQAAVGLCTTDTFPKLSSRTFTLPSSSKTFSIAGLTKGAGMVHPNMATTLGIICTDAGVAPEVLQASLRFAASKTYNCISIDGDTSTNDMIVMFANGNTRSAADSEAFQRILHDFMADMAQLVVRDAEGATKFITIRVRGVAEPHAAKLIAQAIARSSLLKAGFYGKDPGWIGILAAVGYALADTPYAEMVEPSKISLSFIEASQVVPFFEQGQPVAVSDAIVQALMAQEDLEIIVNLGLDQTIDDAVFWTCDMTHDFITLNSGVTQ